MVKSLHDSGISVVLDVVYGHVNSASQFPINRLTPNYYSRPNSNASGCGNDTATERSMNRKFIVDSFVYWATEYHVNGFRIDQEGLFDVDTINEVITALHEIDPSIIVYGEGWDMKTNVTKADTKLANSSSAPDIADGAFFSDGIRDAVKGSVFGTQAGYVTGNASSTSAVINALYSLPGWENYDKPQQSVVNYNSCHDNYTLYDRLQITDGNTTADDETLLKQNSLAASIVMLAQGIPFFQAGEEILRTKVKSDGSFDENSYASPASENSIKWDTLNEDNYKTSYEYYKGLIAFRKLHPSFRGVGEEFQYPDTGAIIKNDGTVITYELPLGMNGDSSRIFVVYNPTDETYTAELPDSGTWNVYAKDDKAGTEVLGTVEDTMDVSPLTCMIVAQDPQDLQEPSVSYKVQVQKTGWEKSYVSDGTTSGTVGQALRLEAIKIKLTNSDGTDFDTTNGGIEYRVHVQKNGWEKEYLANDELSGTVGEAKRLEAIQIRLTGKVADYYDVYYRVQAEKFGWLGWAKNDEEAGTSGYGYRLEGIQVVLVEKDGEAPTEAGGVAASSRNEYYSKTALPVVQYRVQVQTYGWQSYVKNGQTSGTVGKAKRLEAIRIKIADNKGVSGSIQYRTHVQKKGWQKWVSDDALSGTVGKALRLEAIQIKLTGDLAEKYDIYYRVQAEKFGWMGWAKNGASAGTSGYGYRLEAIQIQLAYKNSPSAVIGSTSNAYRSK